MSLSSFLWVSKRWRPFEASASTSGAERCSPSSEPPAPGKAPCSTFWARWTGRPAGLCSLKDRTSSACRFTALENTCLPALIQNRAAAQARAEAGALLGDVGLSQRLHHKPGELSGGEQQRVAVARALMQGPDLVLADEPTGNLDTQTGEALFALLKKLNRDRRVTFVIVTHNEKLSAQADRLIHMEDGRITQV